MKLFQCIPIKKYRVYGKSMEPSFREGDRVLALQGFLKNLKEGDSVVLKNPTQKGREVYIIKRIREIRNKREESSEKAGIFFEYFVVGDNEKGSTDSRHFGWIDKSQIVGKVIYKFSI